MFKLLFSFYLTIHILGDFYFQSNKLIKMKQRRYRYVMFHSLLYCLISCICIIPVWSVQMLILAGILSVSHYIIDSIKYLYLKLNKKEQNTSVFIADQLAHLLCIIIAVSAYVYADGGFYLLSPINDYLSSFISDPGSMSVISWAGLILTASKPANILIKQLASKYRPAEDDKSGLYNAGAFIGTLERIIIILLLSVGQYSAIGLVLTAKSIARYNKIAEDKQFAEYYLLGTLLSAIYSIVIYFIYF